eukprot:CAMPEP_0202964252 /NCGR_PEP_ID=MMETSP1396-20130829/8338_1 /ASSEMBLY_ACC=CAM_ASM_000872 /TAXON_ID= /ORGANISM="Pseudokeronopsis sp., Strain Brazil" /LENGTH=142 /DNA_ID=CAMNT_0049686221 /DNA_START=868 /DNA_END=1293 /DNA_ORIENTATION=+
MEGFYKSIAIWGQTYKFWIEKAKEKKFPIYFWKYEDLLKDNKAELEKQFAFLLGAESIEGTYMQERIRRLLESESKGKTYERRSKDKEEEELYTQEMKDWVSKECEDGLIFFGYAKFEGDTGYVIKNPTEEQRALHGKYKEW